MTKRERWLREHGYRFSGAYSEDREEIRREAADFRVQGYKAQILTKTYQGRIYSVVGYSVYIKDRES